MRREDTLLEFMQASHSILMLGAGNSRLSEETCSRPIPTAGVNCAGRASSAMFADIVQICPTSDKFGPDSARAYQLLLGIDHHWLGID